MASVVGGDLRPPPPPPPDEGKEHGDGGAASLPASKTSEANPGQGGVDVDACDSADPAGGGKATLAQHEGTRQVNTEDEKRLSEDESVSGTDSSSSATHDDSQSTQTATNGEAAAASGGSGAVAGPHGALAPPQTTAPLGTSPGPATSRHTAGAGSTTMANEHDNTRTQQQVASLSEPPGDRAAGPVAWGAAGVRALKQSMASAPQDDPNARQLERVGDVQRVAPSTAHTAMRTLANKASPIHLDESIREMTIEEKRVFEEYVRGFLVLDAPPQFLRATLPLQARIKLLDFHEAVLEGALVAKVPPGVHMGKRMTFRSILLLLMDHNMVEGQHIRSLDVFATAVKRMEYDPTTRLLTAAVRSEALAAAWNGVQFIIQGQPIVFSSGASGSGNRQSDVFSAERQERCYKIRVKAAPTLAAEDLSRIFEHGFAAKILLIERGSTVVVDKFENQFWTITLRRESCPDKLRDVAHVQTNLGELFVHHLDAYPRPPCFSCYGHSHSHVKCRASDLEATKAKHHREVAIPQLPRAAVDPRVVKTATVDQMLEYLTSLVTPAVDSPGDSGDSTDAAPAAEATGTSSKPVSNAGQEATTGETGDLAKEGGSSGTARNGAVKGAPVSSDTTTGNPPAATDAGSGDTAKITEDNQPEVQLTDDGFAFPKRKRKNTKKRVKQDTPSEDGEQSSGQALLSRSVNYGHKQASTPPEASPSEHVTSATGRHGVKSSGKGHTVDVGGGMSLGKSEATASRASVAHLKALLGETAVGSQDSQVTQKPVSDEQEHEDTDGGDMVVEDEGAAYNPRRARVEAVRQAKATARFLALKQKGKAALAKGINGTATNRFPAGCPDKHIKAKVSKGSTASKQSSIPTYYPPVIDGETPGNVSGLEHGTGEGSGPFTGTSSTDSELGSQEDFRMGEVHASTIPPTLLPDLLAKFHARVVDVPANGHCLYGAFFAATAGVCQGERIEYRGGTTALVQDCKSIILEYAQLQAVTEAGLANGFAKEQLRILSTLYPDENWTSQSEAAAATTRLLQHYREVTRQDVTVQVNQGMWGCGEELAAAAIAIREPVYVLDVMQDLAIHVQYYSFRETTNPSGDVVEERVVGTLTAAQFEEFLHTCLDNRVLPPVLLLRHVTGGAHFQAFRFAEDLYEQYLLAEPDDVHPCMRDRLDDVHKVLAMATVSAYTTRSLLSQETNEEVTGNSFSKNARVRRTWTPSVSQETKVERAERLRQADEAVYDRVLALCGDLGRGTMSDRRKHKTYADSNMAAIKQWHVEVTNLGWKLPLPTIASLRKLNTKEATAQAIVKQLFYRLPHPGILAQEIGVTTLRSWGAALAWNAQLAYLDELQNNAGLSEAGREYCHQMYSAAMVLNSGIAQHSFINNAERWQRLRGFGFIGTEGCKPPTLTYAEWELLNIMPYVMWNWRPVAVPNDLARDVAVAALVQYIDDNEHALSTLRRILKANDWHASRFSCLIDSQSMPLSTKDSARGQRPAGTSIPAGSPDRRHSSESPSHTETEDAAQATQADGERQSTLKEHYPVVSSAELEELSSREFGRLRARHRRKKSHRGRRRHAAKDETSLVLHSQNVMGFTRKHGKPDEWFRSFQTRESGKAAGLVLLQETHVSGDEIAGLQAYHCRHWGFDPLQRAKPLSWWAAAPQRRGGVAILCNPYSDLGDVVPLFEDMWTPHWMAISVVMDEVRATIFNIYAPTDRAERELLYRQLGRLSIPTTGPLWVGGDFNCTLHLRVDRTHSHPAERHDSPGLRALLSHWNLVDTLADEVEQQDELERPGDFATRRHTYFYTPSPGMTASSRLDRWSSRGSQWSTSRAQQSRQTCTETVYPLPGYAAKIGAAACADLLADFEAQMQAIKEERDTNARTAQRLATLWDGCKAQIASMYGSVRRDCKAKLLQGHRQRVQRLNQAIRSTAEGIPDSRRSLVSGRNQTEELGDADSVIVLRADLARRKVMLQAQRSHLLHARHSFRQTRTTKDFFRRISTKHLDNGIAEMMDSAGRVSRDPVRMAEIMADGWDATMNTLDDQSLSAEELFADVILPECEAQLQALDDPLDLDEVTRSIEACKRGKAAGPDRLPNDWYRDHSERLGPLLHTLFELWESTGIHPASFTMAHIFCLKKTRASSNPQEFRPIALLNSDYKIYMRTWTGRVQVVVAEVVHPWQAGFVPGHSIHTTIDAFFAAKRIASTDPRYRAALALLLDFAKAYDTLKRRFLLWVLQRYGFPPRFRRCVEALHTGTTSKFIVNGFLSTNRAVTSGIRQGCPLAPLLFVIALDPLYRLIDQSSSIRGIQLRASDRSQVLRIAGYADDTALYLARPAEIPVALTLLSDFGRVSGLRVNIDKSTGIALHADGPTSDHLNHGICIQTSTESCRYLGIVVGSRCTRVQNWTRFMEATAARIALAVAKTHTVMQRIDIARAIIVSKIVYVARHAWPTRDQVNQLQTMVRRFVWGTRQRVPNRAWLSAEIAELPKQHGGLHTPNILTELQTLSDMVVGQWAAGLSPHATLLGDILMGCSTTQHLYVTPRVTKQDVPLPYKPTLWSMGSACVSAAHGRALSGAVSSAMDGLSRDLGRQVRQAYWVNERLRITINDDVPVRLRTLTRAQRTAYGSFNCDWVRHIDVRVVGALWEDGSRPLRVKDWTFCGGEHALGRLVEWTWTATGVLEFQPRARSYPLTNAHNAQFRRLCTAILVTYPGLVERPDAGNHLRLLSEHHGHDHSWDLGDGPDGIRVRHNGNGNEVSSPVTTMSQCERVAGEQGGAPDVRFHAHPLLTKLVQPWSGAQRWRPRRALYRKTSERARLRRGIAAVERRAERWSLEDPTIAAAIASLAWTDVHRIGGTTAMERQTLFKIKHVRTNLWSSSHDSSCCVHEDCDAPDASKVTHHFWTCAEARWAWRTVLQPWMQASGHTLEALRENVFALEAPVLTGAAVEALAPASKNAGDNEAQLDALPAITQELWGMTVAATLHGLWAWRVATLYGDPITPETQRAILLSGVERKLDLLRLCKRPDGAREAEAAFRGLLWNFHLFFKTTHTVFVEPVLTTDYQYLLLFDGGSRGNPGPGGAGSILLRIDLAHRQADLVWYACMAYGSAATTNNIAEYRGLAHGLRHALARKATPLHVAGDSQLILQQMQNHRPPKALHLRRLYNTARRDATSLGVQSWTRHLREYNKMADTAAKIAMDARASMQVAATQPRDETALILQHLASDAGHWFDRRAILIDTSA